MSTRRQSDASTFEYRKPGRILSAVSFTAERPKGGTTMDSGIQVAAMLVIASFVIDRVTGGTFFVLSMFGAWNRIVPDRAAIEGSSDKASAQKRATLAYYLFVAVLATVFVLTFNIEVLKALNVAVDPSWDRVFSVLVLMGGSDQVASLLKAPHAGKVLETSTKSQPIEVTGRLILDDRADRIPPSR